MTTSNDNAPPEEFVALVDLADVGTAIAAARRTAELAGFDETNQYLVATAVSELATNIVRYAGTGEVLLRVVQDADARGIEVVAQDSGPGIPDIELAMRDNYSSGGSLGLGLPGVKRIMDEFRVDSSPGAGTRCTARKWIK
ncbi:anti-sigma regulatory factor [Desulfocurvus sp. DL9XJH121]